MINLLASLVLSLQVVTHTPQEVESLIIQRSLVHGANPSEVVRVARCENTNLIPGLRNYGGSGAIGIGQWLPGRGNHWDRSPAWRVLGIDIHTAYNYSDPDALFYDVDMFSWSFSPEAERMYPGNKRGWSCY